MGLVHLDIKPDNLFISLPDEAMVPTERDEPAFDGLKAQYKIGQYMCSSMNDEFMYVIINCL